MQKSHYWTIGRFISEDSISYLTEDAKKFSGMEIEIKLPLREEHAVEFLNAVIIYCRIKEKPIEPNSIISEIFGVPVIFKVMKSMFGNQEHVLRILFPDTNGLYPDNEKCDSLFKKQLI